MDAPTTSQALLRNLRAGLRVALLLDPGRGRIVATWGQFGILFALSIASVVGWALVQVGWPAEFHPWALPNAVFFFPLIVLVSLLLGALAGRLDDVLGLLVATLSALLWLDALLSVADLAAPLLPGRASSQWAAWFLFYLGPVWLAACIVVAGTRLFDLSWPRRAAAAPIAVGLFAVPLLSADFSGALWSRAGPDREGATSASSEAVTTEDVLYLQPRLIEHELAALLPRHEGRPNLYLVGVAGYGSQDVFRREVDAVDTLFAERFGTRGRSVKLVNNAATVRDTPIATRTSIAAALKRVGALMKPDEDILFLFLTSHGSKDGRFSLSLWPLRLNDLTATDLKSMLDDAGIRNRVIVVSSCYSGSFVDALRDDDTMILTASAKDRNSFGCSNEAEFTYFGKAYFDEALRTTDSFSEAFDRALPVIAERETKDDYKPSAPQRHVGARIEATLAAWRAAKASPSDAQVAAKPSAGPDAYARFVNAWVRPDFAQESNIECRKAWEGASPESVWQRDRNYFGGIGPSSPQWARIDAVWRRYADSSCGTVSQDMLVRLYRDTYREILSDRELAAVAAFIETPAGKKFLRAEHAAASRLTRDLARQTHADLDRAAADYQRAITEISVELRQGK